MRSNFHGNNKSKHFFEGWYFKHQKDNNTIAFIPGVNIYNPKNKCAFIQIITNKNSYNVEYPYEDFSASKDKLEIIIGKNKFTKDGVIIDI